jgi:hypothetical protein
MARKGVLLVRVEMQPGETQEVPDEVFKELQKNPAVKNLFRSKLMMQVKEAKVKAVAKARAKKVKEAEEQLKKVTKAKNEKSVKDALLDTSLVDDEELDL